MNIVKMDPKQQFSKKLARWTAVFWFLYTTWLSVIVILRPAAALYVVYLSLITTAVMIINVWAYTRNSIYEKAMLAMLDKTRLEMTLGGEPSAEDEEEKSDDEEGGSNG